MIKKQKRNVICRISCLPDAHSCRNKCGAGRRSIEAHHSPADDADKCHRRWLASKTELGVWWSEGGRHFCTSQGPLRSPRADCPVVLHLGSMSRWVSLYLNLLLPGLNVQCLPCLARGKKKTCCDLSAGNKLFEPNCCIEQLLVS